MSTSKHHLFFQASYYSTGYGRKLRDAFVYEMDDELHKKIHRKIKSIPKPSETELQHIWDTYCHRKRLVRTSDIVSVLEWLSCSSSDHSFCYAMYLQYQIVKEARDN